jgi:hypothetical protein
MTGGTVRHQLLIVLILGGSVTANAQTTVITPDAGLAAQSSAQLNRTTPPIQPTGQSKNPYSALFTFGQWSRKTALTSKQVGTDAPDAKVVCGMTVRKVHPDLDPRILVRQPDGSRVDAKIQKVAPSACAE